jgi:hypothetical protein
VVSMLASGTFGGLVVSMLASGTFGGLAVSILASGTFGGLVVSMLASGTQVRGFAPGRSRRIFSGVKFLSMPSFGREVKPFAPCNRFAACKRSLNGLKIVIEAKLPDHSRPKFHLSLLGALALIATWRHLVAKVGRFKGRGKQWQRTPKNVPRMQRARAIPVSLTSLWFLPNRPKS